MFVAMVRGSRSISAAAVAALALIAPATGQARPRPPHLTRVRCLPAGSSTCQTSVKPTVGSQLRLSGRRLYTGMRVWFRWSGGALSTRLGHTRVGYVTRVPVGTRLGRVKVTVSDWAGRRSNARRITVIAPPRVSVPAVAPGTLPDVFTGNGMWIWELGSSAGGDIARVAPRPRAAGISTVFVKSSDGPTSRWAQFSPALVAVLHANGLRACAWQFVYGTDPLGEAALGADAVASGADCLVIDAETRYEGRYAQAQQYLGALRAAIGPDFPLGFTSFPYVDYHPRLPYSVFLGPGGAQANLPQVYWRSIGGTVDAVSGHTVAHNRLYGVPIAPLGQTYQNPPVEDLARFRSLWAAYGAAGLSWWSWQATTDPSWPALTQPVAPLPLPPPDPGWPALVKGNKGDEVVWLQEHLASFDTTLGVSATFDDATDLALRNFQA